ncbi:photosystem II stability/assembly factor-like uncharacterized protein [Tenacibaculum adriaticum]|uniref:Photosystem II stability/assembly factor-like uncharacterized protein n=1 Tax=Tenacibaculum adriaticum TaxID=413713 RepID=A0A5S5DWQ0_9FLAO|nr:oxidoreductase [Tenacibaculum adriaticum]TYP99202.1 photosystem II stability/assembly factor-like uncharacterized protein [Tenacibaculum adriaticum]
MKHFLLFISFGILLTSCKNEYKPRVINNITIQEFTIDSTSIRAIEVIDKNSMYYAGSKGDIGFTSDAGKNWKIKNIHFQDTIIPHFRSITKSGENIFALSVGNPALLYKISDKKIDLVYTEEHEKAFYDAMKFFADDKYGIAVGDPTDQCPSIILTSDRGNTWTKIPCDKLPIFENGEAFFAASNTNIKIINNTVWIVSGGKKARMLKSTDKGQTWSIYNTPIVQGNGPQGIYSVDFFDENNGIVIGGDYSKPEDNCKNKAITSDGGKTWEIVSDNNNPNYKSCVQYVPNTNGKEVFAVGKTGVSFSNDGGNTWKEVSKDSYYTIKFVDKNTAWLAGHEKIGKLLLN